MSLRFAWLRVGVFVAAAVSLGLPSAALAMGARPASLVTIAGFTLPGRRGAAVVLRDGIVLYHSPHHRLRELAKEQRETLEAEVSARLASLPDTPEGRVAAQRLREQLEYECRLIKERKHEMLEFLGFGPDAKKE